MINLPILGTMALHLAAMLGVLLALGAAVYAVDAGLSALRRWWRR